MLPDVGSPPVPDGGQFSPGTTWGNRAADLASRFGINALMSLATLPQRAIDASSQDVQHLGDHSYTPQAIGPAVETGMNMLGAGAAVGVPVHAGEEVLAAGGRRKRGMSFEPVDHDPFNEEVGKTYWSDLAKTKHPIAVEDMTATHVPTGGLQARRILTPEDLHGSILTPAVGDRTAAAAELTHINGRPLSAPVSLEGGPDFMRGPSQSADNAAWASDKGVITRLAKHTRALAEDNPGRDVNFVYSSMGGRSGDYSHMMSDALVNQLEGSPISRKAVAAFDASMKSQNPNWPGLRNLDKLRSALANSGPLRKQFVEEVGLKAHQDQGFPEIGSTRFAITAPELIGTPTGSSGYAISRLDPEGRVISAPRVPHTTYNTQLGGTYLGGLAQPIPREVMFPDFFAARRAAGLPKLADDRAFSMSNVAQAANNRWLDGIMKHIEEQKPR
jgi:hypothetical protein